MLYHDALLWIARVLLAHLLTDFLLQAGSWVRDRKVRHFASPWLYAHGGVTLLGALLLGGFAHWGAALVVGVTHTLIDGWKSYRRDNWQYFLLDQLLHVSVILLVGFWPLLTFDGIGEEWNTIQSSKMLWLAGAGLMLQTAPASIFIGLVTRDWRRQIPDVDQATLAHAGKYIGMIERVLIFVLVLRGQFEIIGFLIALKGILRFADEKRSETKTEYLLIGTLLSIGIALLSGLAVAALLK
ncbi:DUF3307 domain-containing protein [Flaviaesturariibacter amylovorans]|uniref:DUF3307 domain-containing protein n=1 Tax=Flaviaesturariibacter amylovorans TaxID=1084520 RepID=A0ABP8H030_9BACT